MKRPFWLAAAVAVVVIAADQLSKWWAIQNLSDGQVIPVIGDFIRFELVFNPGAAFSIGENFTWVFAIIAAGVVVAICWYAWSVHSRAWLITLGLILGGAVTHLGDRLFRPPSFAQGHVVDFIGYGNWFIGNVADIVIFSGAALAVILVLRHVPTQREGEAPHAASEDVASETAVDEG